MNSQTYKAVSEFVKSQDRVNYHSYRVKLTPPRNVDDLNQDIGHRIELHPDGLSIYGLIDLMQSLSSFEGLHCYLFHSGDEACLILH